MGFRSLSFLTRSGIQFFLFCFIFTILFSCTLSPSKRNFDKAEKLSKQKKYSEAIERYSRVISKTQKSLLGNLSYLRVANIYYLFLHDYEKAVFYYKGFINGTSDKNQILYARKITAQILHYDLKDFSQATKEYEYVFQNTPSTEEKLNALLEMAHCYFSMRAYNDARKYYEHVIKQFPQSDSTEEASYQIAVSLYLENRYKEAITRFLKHNEMYHGRRYYLQALRNLALCYELYGDALAALRTYEQVLKENPTEKLAVLKVKRIHERLVARPKKKNTP